MAWAAALCALAGPAHSKTPAQLKQDLAGILPAGKQARLAWLQAGPASSSTVTSAKQSVFVADGSDGIIRELTPASAFPGGNRDLNNPNITADGTRVIFWDQVTQSAFVINWDGTGLRKLAAEGRLNEIWRGPDGSDWAILENGPVRRVDVDKGTEVTLWTKTGVSIDDGISLSRDGTHMAAFFEDNGGYNPGVITVPDKPGYITKDGGCIVSIAPDDSYTFSHQLSGHKLLRFTTAAGVSTDVNTTQDIIAWNDKNSGWNSCDPGNGEYQITRFTSDPGYIAFHMNGSKSNPYLMRLSDRKWISVRDDLDCNIANNMDVLIYAPGGGQDAAPRFTSPPDQALQLNAAGHFDVDVSGTPLPTLAAAGLPAGVSVTNGSTPAASFRIEGTPTAAGSYTAVLTATNRAGSAKDTVLVKVVAGNQAPRADAGPDTSTRVGNDFHLAGKATDDGVPGPLATAWKQVAGPAGGAAIGNAASPGTQVTFSAEGTYRFELSATDGALAAMDSVTVTVAAAIPFAVLKPAAGESIARGSAYTISWRLDPPANVNVALSTDGGKHYDYLQAAQISGSSWTWHVSDTLPLSADCLVRVAVYSDPFNRAVSGRFSLVAAGSAIRGPGRPAHGFRGAVDRFDLDGRRGPARAAAGMRVERAKAAGKAQSAQARSAGSG